ncbi:lamin tail domain-containing protein [Enhygromyxa salina]|uniref:lamin tail domain-containing protein n=1 Tax=Enhygromyxa salina TaxID=215803 RepID=UPI0015E5A20D|nr:lamin tail domain-containing protein [Enhygromyxa salina]
MALVALGPLGCPNDDVSDGNETGGDCGLLAGDLVISEIVANVEGADAGREWFEIYNASGDTIDLQGLTLVYEKIDGSGRKEHVIARSVEIAPGGYAVVSSTLDELAEDAPLVDYGYGGDLGELGNTGGYLAVECGAVIDEVYYEEASETASRALDGSSAPDAIANNDLANWCDSKTTDEAGFAATPQATNDPCGSATTCGDGVEIVHPAVGDLVITEVLPNPDIVGDDVGEWFEIHSLAATEVHLNGVEIGKSLEDDAEETITNAECIALAPGQYALVAANVDAMVNGGLPPEAIVWETGVSLTNNDGSLWLGVGGELLDAVGWGSAGAGKSTQLDPDFLDPSANDELGNWCDGAEPYGAGDFGTPGAANLECLIAPPEGQCYEDGELRDISPVDNGDLEITELMANPEVVDDSDGEWFEVLVKSAGDLNGLQIGKAGGVAHTVDFGDAPAFESDACITVSPGDYVVFAHTSDTAVNGGLPQVDVVFDMALNNSNSDLSIGFNDVVGDQATWTSVSSGHSYSKDPLGTWCDGLGVYGDGDQGTPGLANPACGGGSPDACIDPDNMLMRMINPPAIGELTITEVMPDPSGAPDASGEWFELHASAAFDLNGVQIGKNDVVNHTVSSDVCVEVDADSYLVMARSDVDNCDLPNITYVYADFSLNNSNGNLQIGHGDVVFDDYSWASSSAGAAESYDAMSMMWCDAVAPYGCGDLGTPGDPNPGCGGQPIGDQCMDGMLARDIVVPSPGDLVISEFMANPDAVGDAAGEWFEVRALASFDLNGLELGRLFMDGPMDTIDAVDCIALTPGDTALLARNGDTMTNGGLPLVDFVFGFGLTNSNSALHIAAAGVLLDEITWTSVATGSSTSLDPDSYDPNINDIGNNDGAIWCYAQALYGDGDKGSPGADNPQCN